VIKTFFADKLKSKASAALSITTPTVQSVVSTPTSVSLGNSGRSYVAITWTSANKVATATSTTPYIDIYRGPSIAEATLLASIRDTSDTYTDKTTYPETET
jgi:hypothetical protein